MNISASNQIQYTLTVVTQDIEENSRKLEASLMRILGYIEQIPALKDNEALMAFINTVQAAITTIRSFQIAYAAFLAASGPVGWLYAGVSAIAAVGAGYAVANTAYTYTRGTS